MKASWLLFVALTGALPLGFFGCNLGPFPSFLEELDPLDPVDGEAKGWMLSESSQTRVLVLSDSGQFLHAEVGYNTSVRLEFGEFSIEGKTLILHSTLRYNFPKETGSVGSRIGAQSEEVDTTRAYPADLVDGRFVVDGLGTFDATSDWTKSLDLEKPEARGCLLRFVQVTIRIVQARIRNFGAGGTIIYQNNLSTFAGFLKGEQSIVLEGLLSPETIISYDHLMDLPEVEIDGTFSTFVNTSGSGHLDDFIDFSIFLPGDAQTSGTAGAGPQGETLPQLFSEGSLHYGPEDPLEVTSGDVSGGSYRLEMRRPVEVSEIYSWEFLEDLDLRGCYEASASESE